MAASDTFKGDWRNPQWDAKTRVHDWRNYVSAELQAMWHTFTDEQQLAIARNAAELASLEDWE